MRRLTSKRMALSLIVVVVALIVGAPAALSSPNSESGQSPAGAQPQANPAVSSAFAVQNMDTTDDAGAVVNIKFYNSDGSLNSASFAATIAKGSLGNFALPTSLPSGWQGSVVVESNKPVAAISNLFTPSGSPYLFGSGVGFYPGTNGYTGETGTSMYLPFLLKQRGGRSTTFGIQNAGSTAATVTITYYNNDGSVRETLTPTLQPGQSTIHQQGVTDTFLPSGWMGSVVATSSALLAGSVYDMGDGVLYSYNGTASPSTTLYMPFMVRNRSGQNTAYFIQNTSNNTAYVTVNYVGTASGGASVNVSQSAQIGPKGGWNQGQNTVPGLPDGFLGAATVTSDQPVVGIVNHTYGDFSVVGNKTSYNAFSKGSKTIALPYVLRNRGSKTQGIIIQNVDNVSTNVTFTFTPLAGGANGAAFTKTVSVGPKGFWNFGTNWADFAGMQDGAYGVATVTSDSGSIVAIVNTSRTDSPYGDSLGTYNGLNQ